MYHGALGGMREVTETFVKTCPLLLTGLAVLRLHFGVVYGTLAPKGNTSSGRLSSYG